MLNDLRYAVRSLRAKPGFALVAMLTLALGIGANTAVFSVVNAMLLRPLEGIAEPSRMVTLGRTNDGEGFDSFTLPDLVDYREGAREVVDIAWYRERSVHVSTGGASERVSGGLVSGNYFAVLGQRPTVGRLVLPADDGAPGAHPVVVLSHPFWRGRFGGDSAAIGRTLNVNGSPFTIVGVAAPGFESVQLGGGADVFFPIAEAEVAIPGAGARLLVDRRAHWLDAIGRLRPGVPLPVARARLDAIAADLQARYPDSNEGRGIAVAAGIGLDPGTRDALRSTSRLLLAVVALVLLIACGNVANLLLARGAARAREMAVRASLGASRVQLVRSLLAESVVLAAVGGALGLWLAFWLDEPLSRLPFLPLFVPNLDLTPDPTVLLFTLGVTVAATILFGLPPALHASRVSVAAAMKEGHDPGGRGSRFRNLLVAGQLAASLVLLVGAGLLVRTLQRVYAVAPGYETDRLLVASVNLGLQGYDEERGRAFFDAWLQGARALPGVESASLAFMVPLGFGGWDSRAYPGERAPDPDDPGIKVDQNSVTPGYFRTMGMVLVEGRDFSEADAPGASPVAIVNQALADTLWPGQSALGRRMWLTSMDEPSEIVGVVRDAKYRSVLEDRRPFVYYPFAQAYWSAMSLHVRAADPRDVIPGVRAVVQRLDADLPVSDVGTLEQRREASFGSQRSMATLVGGFAMLALLLAAIGLYGTLSYLVSRRTREIGVRMAVGAAAADIRTLVLRQGARLLAAGALAGLAVALVATRVIRSLLFGVTPFDPVTFILVLAFLSAVGLAASYVPARRASRVDPMEALRYE